MCGAGTAVREARRLGRRAAGSDINPEAIKICTSHDPDGDYRVCDARNIDCFEDGIFGLALCVAPIRQFD